ncbi:hypothetical protein WMR10_001153 [Stenotrophomonas maltophilia]|jgi:hypothetical protein|uniref:hypothetical protein n=1 Tax=Stenotrophomonas sp. Sm0581 TaxID=3002749 RepID=UPI00066E9743|nr:hypothetical protein [Stenotrophomonas sp. Sm0581]KYK42048.1 hypothetical protein AYX08_15375 [Stenotrophomonas maltophilia]SSM87254.1 Uncharacterised protein [Acinetobacter baumannii]MDQ7301717.1 hypothetical protein [Stenotrophomonas sp. Sm0581]PZS41310.1 hypothetical protein A7X61_17070 [Stenotrophomonas maltophilia]PZS49305.1 hypothetical protein A7X60_05970 [Stenotrophomonas maltophilia]
MVSTETVAAAMGAGQYAQPLGDACIQFGTVTVLQKAHFLAQEGRRRRQWAPLKGSIYQWRIG